MKMKQMAMALALLLGAAGVEAQVPEKENGNVRMAREIPFDRMIPPHELEVSYEKTVHLLFPSEVRYVDLGSPNIIAGKAEDAVLSITIREQPNGESRISLRSSPEVDCSEICAVFGGGGHAMAAGCTIQSGPEKAKKMLLDVIDEVWK